jgi:hypothetical protein
MSICERGDVRPETRRRALAVRGLAAFGAELTAVRGAPASSSNRGELAASLDTLDIAEEGALGALADAIERHHGEDGECVAALHVLKCLGVSAARKYDLGRTAEALRVLSSRGADSALVTGLASFLLDQQNFDGGFGFFGPELAMVAHEVDGFDADEDLRLPITVAALRALSQAAPAYGEGAALR